MLSPRYYLIFACLALGAACARVPVEQQGAQPGAQQGAQPGAQPVAKGPEVSTAATQGAPIIEDPGASQLLPISGGDYEPLFPGKDAAKNVPVAAFQLEVTPVSIGQYLAFVHAVPKWRRSRIPRLFADLGYLALWAGDLDPGPGQLDLPVTGISWFAARAYCKWRGRRLPTVAEWELAAAQPLRDGGSPSKTALQWYGRPAGGQPNPIGSGSVSSNGVRDIYGLVWEWVDDFSSAMVTGDGRSDTDLQRGLFCGAGAVGAARPEDYAAFMRYAMRSSLAGDRTTRSLGFRCAKDVAKDGAQDAVVDKAPATSNPKSKD